MTREEIGALLDQPLYPLGDAAEREAYADQVFAELQEGQITFAAIHIALQELTHRYPKNVEGVDSDPDIPYSLVILMLRSDDPEKIVRQGLRGWLEYQASWVRQSDHDVNDLDILSLAVGENELASLGFPNVFHQDVSGWFSNSDRILRAMFYEYRWELPPRLCWLVEPTGEETYRWRAPLVVAGLGTET